MVTSLDGWTWVSVAARASSERNYGSSLVVPLAAFTSRSTLVTIAVLDTGSPRSNLQPRKTWLPQSWESLRPNPTREANVNHVNHVNLYNPNTFLQITCQT
jgi:hypothetical protein